MHRNNNIKKNNILILVMILTIRRIKTGEQYFHEHSVLKKKNQKKVENQPSTTLTAALTKTKTTNQFRDIRKIYRHFM